MKTTVVIHDQLYERAQRKAQRDGRSMRSLIEEGLQRCLDADREAKGRKYELPDRSSTRCYNYVAHAWRRRKARFGTVIGLQQGTRKIAQA